MQAAIPRLVTCPQCGTQIEYSPTNPWRPFCSERCKLIDLGAWATEGYRIPDNQPPQVDDSKTDDKE